MLQSYILFGNHQRAQTDSRYRLRDSLTDTTAIQIRETPTTIFESKKNNKCLWFMILMLWSCKYGLSVG